MYFAGRWVPMDVMNSLFVLWAISAIVLGALIWWLWRKTPTRPKRKPQRAARRRKQKRQET